MTRLAIVTSHWKEDLDWLKKATCLVVVGDHEGADPMNFKPDFIIPNKGQDMAVWFRYIIDNYDNLPDHVAFIHGHETSYHQRLPEHFLKAIETANIDKYDFIPLNNFWRVIQFADYPKEPNPLIIQLKLDTFWDVFGVPFPKPPIGFPLVVDVSNQFIVSRRRILAHPKELYEKWFNIITETNSVEPLVFLEYTCHIIFGEPWQLAFQSDWFPFPVKQSWWHDDRKFSLGE
jgi:hypothetical protein